MTFKDPRFTSTLAPVLMILFLGGSLLLFRLGGRPLGKSEGRWGEAAREMIMTHNWVVPKINGIPYRDKPVGSYWLVVLASLPRHRVTETTTRLPSALAVLLCGLTLYSISRRFWDGKTALLTSFLLLTTYPMIFWGRTADADTLTLAGVLICIWLFIRRRDANKHFGWLYPFFIVAGVTSLMKGLLGFVLPFLCVFPYLLIRDPKIVRDKRFIFHLLVSAILGGVLFSIPFFLDYETSHTAQSIYLVFKENIIRFFHPFDHKAPFFYYFYYIFVTVSPWSLFIPFLILFLWKRKAFRDEGAFFFGLWFVLLFAFFTVSGSKRGYYLIPVIPAFSALLVYAFNQANLQESMDRLEWLFLMIPIGLIVALSLTVLFLSTSLFAKELPHNIPETVHRSFALAGAVMAVTGGIAWLNLRKGKIIQFVYSLVTGTFILFCLLFWSIFPTIAKQNPFISFCKTLNPVLKGGEAGIYGLADRGILYFYLDKVPIPYFRNPEKARTFLNGTPHAYLIIRGWETVEALGIKNPKIIVSEKGTKRGETYYLIASH